ncbi:MAG: PH domain-containing protein, partial [Actinomycetota bacterium]
MIRRQRVTRTGGTVRIRSSWRWLLLDATLWVAVATLFAIGFAVAVVSALGAPAGVVLAVWGAVTVVLVLRALRAGLDLSPDGVVVRNVLRSHVIPWDEISRIETCSFAAQMERFGGLAVRRGSGRLVRARGLGSLSGPYVHEILALVRRTAER